MFLGQVLDSLYMNRGGVEKYGVLRVGILTMFFLSLTFLRSFIVLNIYIL